jgi:hypothetical protein
VHLVLGSLEERLVGPDLPGEHDLLAWLGRHRTAEVGLLAVGNEVFPALDDLQAAVVLEDLRPVLGPSAIGLDLPLGTGMTRPQTYMVQAPWAGVRMRDAGGLSR